MATNQPKRELKVVAPPDPPKDPIRPPVRAARARKRHMRLALSYFLIVLLPSIVAGWYLWERAVDQYASNVGFTVRREEAPSPVDLLGGLSSFSTGGSSDSDILFEFIQSQELVQTIERQMDLREIYAANYDRDPLFSLRPDSPIEELLRYWRRMVQISYAPGTGMIDVKVLAFEPRQAQAIAAVIFEESSRMINQLAAIAREDTIRYAREELDRSVEQLKQARQVITAYRSRTQIVDPKADINLQMGLLTSLQQQLGDELISFDLLRETTRGTDPRVMQAEQRIAAIRERIRQEREKFGSGAETASGEDYATLIAEFERITVDREFAEQKYKAALSNFDAAQAAAQRQNRYLAAYVRPTLAESAEYPRRELLLGLFCLFLVVGWAILALMFYAVRDRR